MKNIKTLLIAIACAAISISITGFLFGDPPSETFSHAYFSALGATLYYLVHNIPVFGNET